MRRATYIAKWFAAFMLAGVLCIGAALMVLFIGAGRRGREEPAGAPAAA